jgi:hypothetical protein
MGRGIVPPDIIDALMGATAALPMMLSMSARDRSAPQ